ncbi:DNA-binding MarR family transcriptional regulator [Methanohalophilus levihalophilus]|uniref:MarR family winged helix-turn-helix transcriptional regulator n=1 Tax=Methanohalophilus levihalophilus TaxID=1431282 RepID=UPI001AE6E5EF|nr:MarR family winged helix-turn-helix transcriptional regulator [Methanohalophilus levihalophilus]MBP2031070.1 DNA-binding MarR family transcriptional regulator [Methanohalophilus levihalophilus]
MPDQLSFENVSIYYNKIVNDGKFDNNKDLSARLYLYLNQIRILDNPTMSELAASVRVSKPAVSNAVKKLQEMGLVDVQESMKDRRSCHLCTTSMGYEVLDVLDSADQQFFRKIEEILGDEDFRLFSNLWTRISAGLEEETQI